MEQPASLQTALILFAHGARDPDWAQPFRTIQRALQARLPHSHVELAFLEIMEPALAETLERLTGLGCHQITVAPLFMAQGGHLKRDVPALLETLRVRYPGLTITLLPAIGDVDPILDAITNWLAGALK